MESGYIHSNFITVNCRKQIYLMFVKKTLLMKLKKAQNELANFYLKEQSEYIQNQID